MKKCVFFLLICILFYGCSAEETFETILDQPVSGTEPMAAQVLVMLPEEAAVPASESESGQLYLCDGYDILLQTLPGGDLDATLRSVTGYGCDDLNLIQTGLNGVKRYDLVWSCMGESGDRVGRAAVLDDGYYHYVLCVLSDAERTREFEEEFSELFENYSLG